METPRTLTEAIRRYSDPRTCLSDVAEIRWPKGPVCPRCDAEGKSIAFMPTRGLWRCKSCKKQFSVKLGTIFEDSPIGLDKWLTGMWLVNNCKNGISSYELSKDIGVTQRTAWFMLHRLRLVMQTRSFSRPLGGEVEADETFIGGKARFMHKDKKARVVASSKTAGKVAVMALLERNTKDASASVMTVEPASTFARTAGSSTLRRFVGTTMARTWRVLSGPWRSSRPMTAVLPAIPVPLILAARLSLCMKRALPPM